MTTRLPYIRRLAALILLSVMGLGSVGHFWHHLADPDCGAIGKRGSQPCATCSALHGSILAAKAGTSARPLALSIAQQFPAVAVDPPAAALSTGAPRAPPIA